MTVWFSVQKESRKVFLRMVTTQEKPDGWQVDKVEFRGEDPDKEGNVLYRIRGLGKIPAKVKIFQKRWVKIPVLTRGVNNKPR